MKPYRGKQPLINQILRIAFISCLALIIAAGIKLAVSARVYTPLPTITVDAHRFNPADTCILNAPTVTYVGTYTIHGYDPWCPHCVGKENPDGITKSNAPAVVGRTVAMQGVPFGTRVYIEDVGLRIVEDRGGGSRVVDVACEDHAACFKITSNRAVYIIGYS